MNNAQIIMGEVKQSEEDKPILREKASHLTEIIDACQNIQSSSYWKVLKQYIFDVDLKKSRSRLETEKDTTEIFRLQGEIRWGERFDLEKISKLKRSELEIIKQKIN